ncbi:hypothetical protein Tco_1113480 [Tanacetum coccineum]|uniref:Reverse transcriptase/retrotransposon-derived protein RNase H-like domain-containing protein n=1 Tax=Tanacetum coccineum TaxID=301880 RepID=A0ABQ5ISC5_9ASTR
MERCPPKFRSAKNCHQEKDCSRGPVQVTPVRSVTCDGCGLRCLRIWIENFSKIAKPLTLLTQKNNTYVWGDKQDEALRILKEKASNAQVLHSPNGPDDLVLL